MAAALPLPNSLALASMEENQFRLAHLLPSPNFNDHINIVLDIHDLVPSKLPFYEAVSYVWGDSSSTETILCDGNQVEVTLSAASVLRRFRLSTVSRLLWIDQICVNQADVNERNQSVAVMGKIYSYASRVLVYIGEEEAQSTEAMDYVASRTGIHDSILKLLERPWFNRVWVLQEVALAQVALVVCGTKCVPWACFPVWWQRNSAQLGSGDILEPPGTLIYDPAIMKRSSLLQQLHDTRGNQATDPRDKVYALMGLLTLEDRNNVLVDYKKSIDEVYTEVAVSILRRENCLRLLSAVQYLEHTEICGDYQAAFLPSWVPNWSSKNPTVSLGLSNPYMEPYDAGGQPACGMKIEFESISSQPRLYCSGIILDTIRTIGEICWRSLFNNQITDCLNSWDHLIRNELMDSFLNENNFVAPTDGSHDHFHSISQRVHYHKGQFYAIKSRYLDFWATILAQPSPTIEPSELERLYQDTRPIELEGLKLARGRAMFSTQSYAKGMALKGGTSKGGFLGLAPPNALPGDIVTILLGAPVPVILRPIEDGLYQLVGECYVHGVMGGEALAHLSKELRAMGHRSRPFLESVSNAKLMNFVLV